MTRTDAHAPSNFDPSDYVVVDYLDNKKPAPPEGRDMTAAGMEIYERAVAAWQERVFSYFPDWRTGGTDHTSIHTCNHCGHQGIRWVAVAKHIPTGAFLAFGEICADRCDLSGRDAFRSKFIKTRAELEAAALANALAKAEWAAENIIVSTFLAEQAEAETAWRNWNEEHGYDERPGRNPIRAPHPFILDMIHTLNRYGKLSEKQTAATAKFAAKNAEFAARDAEKQAERATELATAGPLEVGRRVIVGTILSTKVKESQFGSVLKMCVKQADGNKVWGTVPEALESMSYSSDSFDTNGMRVHTPAKIESLVGTTVEFTATVERSADDEHFGFYKRPTGIKVVA